MSYDSLKKEFVQELIHVVELDQRRCSLTYGVAPCTASGATGEECYNTSWTCQDRQNIDLSAIYTHTFCSNHSPTAKGLQAIPSLQKAPSLASPKLDIMGGIGLRGGSSLMLKDHPYSDIGTDPYISTRPFDAYEKSTYWAKFLGRDQYYVGYEVRIKSGYLTPENLYLGDNFLTRTYVMEGIKLNNGVVSLTCKDILKLSDNKRAKYPKASTGQLVSGIDSSQTTFLIDPYTDSDGNPAYEAGGKIRIDDEVMDVTTVTPTTGDEASFSVVRATESTTASSHNADAIAQWCWVTDGLLSNLLYELLTDGVGIDPSYINLADWTAEVSTYYPYDLTTVITEPVGVKRLLEELNGSAPYYMWWGDVQQKIQLSAMKEPGAATSELDDDLNLLADKTAVVDAPKLRLSQVWVYYGLRTPVLDLDKAESYERLNVRADLDAESDIEYGTQRVKLIHSRFLSRTNLSGAQTVCANIGRRFGDTPKQITFTLAPKDDEITLATSVDVTHRDVVDSFGDPEQLKYQITERKFGATTQYTAVEYTYRDALPDDPDTGVLIVSIPQTSVSVNLRDEYDDLYGSISPVNGIDIRFVFESDGYIVSSGTGTASVETGSWPERTESIQLDVRGAIAGKGGDGGGSLPSAGGQGGSGLELGHDVEILPMIGWIAGGGGGGGAGGSTGFRGGGGGAAFGLGGRPGFSFNWGQDASLESGGAGGGTTGGAGGDSGVPGESGTSGGGAGGAAGDAIRTNGYSITWDNAADETDTSKIKGNIN